MSSTLGVRDYREHNWSTYEVKEAEDAPKASHFGACIFDTYYTDGGWSEKEGGGNYPVPYVRYYALPSKELLEQWVAEASATRKHFFIFGARMAEAQVRVEVEVSL